MNRRMVFVTAQSDRLKAVMKTPEDVVVRRTAARRSRRNEREVLVKQTRKIRAEQVVKCTLMSGKRTPKTKPLTELFVSHRFTKDRGAWEKEVQRHCAEVYVHPRRRLRNKIKELQSTVNGERYFTEQG